MKPITLLLFIVIVAFPMIYISGCAPYSATYGVNVHAGPRWGYHPAPRHYHHRPAYRPHSRPSRPSSRPPSRPPGKR